MIFKSILILVLVLPTLVGCNPFYSVEQSMVERGYRWIRRGELGKAIDTFEMTTQKYPQSVLAHVGRADALFEARRDKEAVDSYTKAITFLEKTKSKSEGNTPNKIEVIGKRFFSYQNQGLEFPHGIEAYIYLRRGGAFEGLAFSDSKLNQKYFPKAIADYDKAIELAPNYEEAKNQRNRLLQKSKNQNTE